MLKVNYNIVQMKEEHIPDIAKLEKECFSLPWSENTLLNAIKRDGDIFLTAISPDGEILGYGGMQCILDECDITNIAVFEQYRRKGIANALLNALIKSAKEKNSAFITLEVRASNEAAVNLYKSHGFEKVGERRCYYEKPREDAVLMTLFLKGDYNENIIN